MKKIFKLFLPVLVLLFYSLFSFCIYYGVNDDVFSIKDTVQIVAGNLILIALLLLYARFICGSRWNDIFNIKMKLKEIVIVLLMIPGIQFLSDKAVISFLECFQETYAPEIRDLGEFKIFLFDALFASIIAPVLEELLFRLCIISSYHTIPGKLYGIIVGSILFGYMHSTIPARLSAMIFGIILGVVFWATGNLLLCIIIHAGSNLLITICACVSIYLQSEETISFVSTALYVNTPILVVSVVISFLGAVLLFQKHPIKPVCEKPE